MEPSIAADPRRDLPPAVPPAGGNVRWTVCALLFFATTINYFDRQILSLTKPILDVKLGWTNEQFGYVNAAFQGAYAVGLLAFGWIVDQYGVKIGYALSLTAWSLAAAGHGLVDTVTGFAVARIFLGLGEGGNFPSAIKAIALWHPKRERAFATSLSNTGANVGPILAPAVVPWIALRYGWQAAFVAAGVVGLFWLAFWLPLYRAPENQPKLGAAERAYIESDREEDHGEPNGKASWGALLRWPQAWSFIVAKFLTDPVWWFFLIWLPDYFNATRGLDINHSWAHLITIYSIITVLSIIGGWITGHLASRGWSVTRARKTGLFVFRAVRATDLFRHAGWRLDGGAAHRAGGRGAPGVVRQPLHDGLGHVPQERRGLAHRHRRHGGINRWDDFSRRRREDARPLQGPAQRHGRLRDPVHDLRVCLSAGVRAEPPARAAFRAGGPFAGLSR